MVLQAISEKLTSSFAALKGVMDRVEGAFKRCAMLTFEDERECEALTQRCTFFERHVDELAGMLEMTQNALIELKKERESEEEEEEEGDEEREKERISAEEDVSGEDVLGMSGDEEKSDADLKKIDPVDLDAFRSRLVERILNCLAREASSSLPHSSLLSSSKSSLSMLSDDRIRSLLQPKGTPTHTPS